MAKPKRQTRKPAVAKIVDLDEDNTDNEEEEEQRQHNGTSASEEKENDEPSTSSHSLFADCVKHFGTKDLYSVLNIDKAACTSTEIKKAYYKLSLKYHPDKSEAEHKETNEAKFKTLGKIYSVLSDDERKRLYDEQDCVADDDAGAEVKDWSGYWRAMFKKVSKSDVDAFFAEYRDSAEERADLLRLYEKHAGDMDCIMDEIYSRDLAEDEPRFRDILEAAIADKTVPAHAKFVRETKAKANKRRVAYVKEAREAEQERAKRGLDGTEASLMGAIMARQKERAGDDFLARLEKKYAALEEEDDDDGDDEASPSIGRKPRVKKGKKSAAAHVKAAKASASKVKRL